MESINNFGETENVRLTVLVDNTADIIVRSTEGVKYHTGPPLLAEHGFSALIQLNQENKRILWDAGITRVVLLENMKRMGIDPKTINTIALSHGHFDHHAAIIDILEAAYTPPRPKKWSNHPAIDEIENWMLSGRIPLVVHPATFRERWRQQPDGSLFGPMQSPPKDAWSAAGADIILSEDPYPLGTGCWTTGGVPRESFETSGIPQGMIFRERDQFYPDFLEEDQAIVINVKNKGLVILSGCAHSGIVNTVNHARRISGVEKIYAIIGGFHLASSNEEDIQRTIEAVMAFAPEIIAPSHCTGMQAICEFSVQMPDKFVRGIVGASYIF